jgi:SAM-dependent methyltransferase
VPEIAPSLIHDRTKGVLAMGFYDRYIMPRLINYLCSDAAIADQRRKVVTRAEGVVLEIGIGSGLNLPFYDPDRVDQIIGVDPDESMWDLSAERRRHLTIPLERLALSGERIPLEDDSVDCVLVTYALCTIPDPIAALHEMRRVLKPEGRLLFAEHGEAPDDGVRRWQRRIDPLWKKLAGGCHSGRPIPRLLRQAGWELSELEQGYISGPKVLGYEYWGVASQALVPARQFRHAADREIGADEGCMTENIA